MKHDLFSLCFSATAVRPDETLTMALHTKQDAAGVRTLRYRGEIVGHYHRAHTHRHELPLWRGVTDGGQIVYGRSELDVRRELLERYA